MAPPASGGFLSDWRVQVPIGFLAAIPLVQLEVRHRSCIAPRCPPLLHASSFSSLLVCVCVQVFVINEETQLLGCFMVFVGTMYSQAGDAIGKMLDMKGEAVIA